MSDDSDDNDSLPDVARELKDTGSAAISAWLAGIAHTVEVSLDGVFTRVLKYEGQAHTLRITDTTISLDGQDATFDDVQQALDATFHLQDSARAKTAANELIVAARDMIANVKRVRSKFAQQTQQVTTGTRGVPHTSVSGRSLVLDQVRVLQREAPSWRVAQPVVASPDGPPSDALVTAYYAGQSFEERVVVWTSTKTAMLDRVNDLGAPHAPQHMYGSTFTNVGDGATNVLPNAAYRVLLHTGRRAYRFELSFGDVLRRYSPDLQGPTNVDGWSLKVHGQRGLLCVRLHGRRVQGYGFKDKHVSGIARYENLAGDVTDDYLVIEGECVTAKAAGIIVNAGTHNVCIQPFLVRVIGDSPYARNLGRQLSTNLKLHVTSDGKVFFHHFAEPMTVYDLHEPVYNITNITKMAHVLGTGFEGMMHFDLLRKSFTAYKTPDANADPDLDRGGSQVNFRLSAALFVRVCIGRARIVALNRGAVDRQIPQTTLRFGEGDWAIATPATGTEAPTRVAKLTDLQFVRRVLEILGLTYGLRGIKNTLQLSNFLVGDMFAGGSLGDVYNLEGYLVGHANYPALPVDTLAPTRASFVRGVLETTATIPPSYQGSRVGSMAYGRLSASGVDAGSRILEIDVETPFAGPWNSNACVTLSDLVGGRVPGALGFQCEEEIEEDCSHRVFIRLNNNPIPDSLDRALDTPEQRQTFQGLLVHIVRLGDQYRYVPMLLGPFRIIAGIAVLAPLNSRGRAHYYNPPNMVSLNAQLADQLPLIDLHGGGAYVALQVENSTTISSLWGLAGVGNGPASRYGQLCNAPLSQPDFSMITMSVTFPLTGAETLTSDFALAILMHMLRDDRASNMKVLIFKDFSLETTYGESFLNSILRTASQLSDARDGQATLPSTVGRVNVFRESPYNARDTATHFRITYLMGTDQDRMDPV